MPRFVRFFASVVVCLMVVSPPGSGASTAAADTTATEDMLRTRSLGNADAPVTIEEFSSLTCPHCATFHRVTLPQIKAEYIETGKVRIVFHDFPLDPLALAAAMITRCVPEEEYWPFLDRLFQEQPSWAGAEKPVEALSALAAEAGLDEAGFNACFANAPLMTGLRNNLREQAELRNIQSTPTFFVGGERISGARPYADFQAIIERKLAAAEPATVDGEPATSTN